MDRWIVAALVAGFVAVVAAAGWWIARQHARVQGGAAAAARYVGAQACADCHREQYAAWRGSQHQLAMQQATPASVLGDFDGARFTYAGFTSTFFRRDDKYFVRTDGKDGKPADFEIKYTFGVAPLQQYLIEFPDGRLQALSIAWDTRPKAQGGGRWYHLYPKERITYSDPLHWTGLQQNWNFMCAQCHSTNLRRNYDPSSDTFKTTWSDISVGCEACHGPGSQHLAWARERGRKPDPALVVRFDERAGIGWVIDAATGNAARSTPRRTDKEIETCALCHSRRAQIWEEYAPGRPLSDTHQPALLTEGLYEADGQMRDEVYNYGSFLQSRMYEKGVTCADCHDPHTGKLRAPGNGVCYQCHAPQRYAGQAHTGHATRPDLASCPACHMPVREYMVIDPRHDHSFRVPRPDLSVKLGTPNACNDCHRDKSAQWAAAAVERWLGPQRKGLQAYAPALHAARTQSAEAKNLLFALVQDRTQPAIARATAYQEIAPYLTPSLVSEMRKGLADADPLVRLGTLRGLAGVPSEQRWALAGQLLSDPARVVRLEAVSFLLQGSANQLGDEQRAALDRAVEEYIAAQRVNADRPESHLNLGLLYASRGAPDLAEAQYRLALKLDPHFVRATVNLAQLYGEHGRDADGEVLLRKALASAPEPVLHHALGLLLVRAKRYDEALVELARAARVEPTNARYSYVYAVALSSSGRRREAVKWLEANHRRHPADRDTLLALVTLNRDLGDRAAALGYARKLEQQLPSERGVKELVRQLEGRP